MTLHGLVKNGVVILDEPSTLPEGARVIVSFFDFTQNEVPEDQTGETLYERLMPAIGAAKGLPPDASTNVDHYLYGAPKA